MTSIPTALQKNNDLNAIFARQPSWGDICAKALRLLTASVFYDVDVEELPALVSFSRMEW